MIRFRYSHAAVLLVALAAVPLSGCAQPATAEPSSGESETKNTEQKPEEKPVMNLATATFGGGCFWCTEAVFTQLKGVESVTSGYMGGRTESPTYEDICTGLTGHAEVIQIEYDPQVVPFEVLLEVFWKTHDPTTLNRQGNDVGTQYRSVVFYHDDQQQKLAEQYKKKLDESGAFNAPIVTEITTASTFYPAEEYHQDYYAQNPNQGYCQAVIPPKLEKLRKVFGDRLKDAERK